MSENVNLFEKASRLKLRFKTTAGLVNTEDLWDESLQTLDSIAKSLNKEIKEATEESFIKTRTKSTTVLELGFEIVKYVIEVKLAEAEAKKTLAERKALKERYLELISQKENEVLGSKSLDELKAEFEQL